MGPAVTPAVTILYTKSASRCYLLLSAPIGTVVVQLVQWCSYWYSGGGVRGQASADSGACNTFQVVFVVVAFFYL